MTDATKTAAGQPDTVTVTLFGGRVVTLGADDWANGATDGEIYVTRDGKRVATFRGVESVIRSGAVANPCYDRKLGIALAALREIRDATGASDVGHDTAHTALDDIAMEDM